MGVSFVSAQFTSSGSVASNDVQELIGFPAGVDLVVAAIANRAATVQPVSAVSWDGIPFTEFGTVVGASGSARASLWWMPLPAAGVNRMLRVQFPANQFVSVVVAAFSGVDPESPFHNVHSTSGFTTSAGISIIDPGESNDALIIDCLARRQSGTEPAANAGQTERGKFVGDNSTPENNVWAALSTKTGGTNTTMGWTWSSSRQFAYIAAALRPSVPSFMSAVFF